MKNIIVGVVVGAISGVVIAPLISNHSMHHNTNERHGAHDHMEGHTHEVIEVAADAPAPTVTIEALEDSMSGYNLHITTNYFTFTPETVNQAVVQNTGHAHLYINDVKITRLYSSWFHIDEVLLAEGKNTVKVTLNANNHSEWQLAGETIASTITITK